MENLSPESMLPPTMPDYDDSVQLLANVAGARSALQAYVISRPVRKTNAELQASSGANLHRIQNAVLKAGLMDLAKKDVEAAQRVLEMATNKITGDKMETSLNRLGRAVLEPLSKFKGWAKDSVAASRYPDREPALRAVQMATALHPTTDLMMCMNR